MPPTQRRPAAALALLATPLALACGPDAMAGSENDQADGSLGAPTATFPDDFGTILSVRELDDGRVLVADPWSGTGYRGRRLTPRVVPRRTRARGSASPGCR